MAKKLTTVHGIIFKRRKYRDFDLLVKIISQEIGIATLLVRGGLRPKSKLAADVLNFSYGDYEIYSSGKGISTLRTTKKVSQFANLFADLEKNAYAAFILDLIDHAFVEYQPLGAYYDLAATALTKIDQGADPEIIAQIVQLKMLKAYGLAPNLRSCTICGKTEQTFDYSIKLGGLVCSDHFASQVSRLHLTTKEVALLRTMYFFPITRLGQIKVSPALKKRTHWAIDRIYRETADLNLKSKKFLDELRLF
jgi:DNA repair protein RecO (recombination protein O)